MVAEDPGVRIILLSAYLDTDAVIAAEELGVHAVISKESVFDLARVVQDALG